MAEIVNLRQARKQKRRDDKERQAAGNRVKFGRTKAEKTRDATEAKREQRHLDQAKLTPDTES
jgi:hypothetical protein